MTRGKTAVQERPHRWEEFQVNLYRCARRGCRRWKQVTYVVDSTKDSWHLEERIHYSTGGPPSTALRCSTKPRACRGHECEDSPNHGFCRDCDEVTCEDCAGLWEPDGGYGEDGSRIRITVRCRTCQEWCG